MYNEIFETCSPASRAVSSSPLNNNNNNKVVETCSPASRAFSSSPLPASSLVPSHHIVLRLVPRFGHDSDPCTSFHVVPCFLDLHNADSGSLWRKSCCLRPPWEMDFILHSTTGSFWLYFHFYFEK